MVNQGIQQAKFICPTKSDSNDDILGLSAEVIIDFTEEACHLTNAETVELYANC